MVFSFAGQMRTMKKYLLLRDNQESGPFSFDELASMNLKPLDLVWIENESTSWQYASEMEELKSHVTEEKSSEQLIPEKKKIFISLPSNFSSKRRTEEVFNDSINSGPVLETNLVQPLEELKERLNEYETKKISWPKKIVSLKQALNIAAIFLGVVFGSVIVKKFVDGLNDNSTADETTVSANVITQIPPKENRNNVVAVTNVPHTMDSIHKRKIHPTDIRKMVIVKSNDYKVGLFGGINDLKLTVYNSSPHLIDKALIEVEYLKPNGDIIGSGQFQFNGIRGKSSKTLSIPKSNRGVKVRYRIVNVYSHEYAAMLKQA